MPLRVCPSCGHANFGPSVVCAECGRSPHWVAPLSPGAPNQPKIGRVIAAVVIAFTLIFGGFVIFVLWAGCFLGCTWNPCPSAFQMPAFQGGSTGGSVGFPGGHNVSFPFSVTAWSKPSCSLPALPLSAKVVFSNCVGGPCGADLSIYTASDWTNETQGRSAVPLWCYSSSPSGPGVGACVATGNTSFSTSVPGGYAQAHPSGAVPFVFVISSMTVGESYSLTLNVTSEFVPSPP